jgi:molybdopterin-binding protein
MPVKTPTSRFPSRPIFCPARPRRGSVASVDNLVRIGAAASALGVSVDTLRRWERDGRVTFERHGGQRYLQADDLAALLRERTVSGAASARNRLTGVIVAVHKEGIMAQVDLACGPFRIVSLMSRESAEDMELAPGMPATAVIKATTVLVER